MFAFSSIGLHRLIRALPVAALALWAGGAAMGEGVRADPAVAGRPAVSDVDLDDVPIGNALKLLAEIYDVSIATGKLPDTRVTVRLRGVGAREAFESVAAAAGLAVSQQGKVLRLSPRAAETQASRIVPGPFPAGAEAGLDGMDAAGVEVRRIGDGALLLAGPESGVKAASEALGGARRRGLVERVFPLSAAPGEETQKAVQLLLETGLESATYEATGHQLTVSALPATMARVEALLTELTRPPAQYEIEVRVVEVSRSALRQMGAQGRFGLDIQGGVLTTSFPFDKLTDSHRYLPSPSDLAALGRLGGSGAGGETGSFQDSGFRFGRIDGRGIGLLIQLLEQSGEARVVATPKVTALDNREARISMVTTLRIPTFTQNQAFATTTVTGIEKIDVGTTLEVRPRRGEGRQILLSVTPEVSELEPEVRVFSQSGLTQGLPIVTRRRTETEVLLESGETLVIGGLVTERESKTHGKTPGLGDIPLVGRLFRLEGKNSEGSELLVFVTPRQLPPPEERRAKVRVDEAWIPTALAAEVEAARARLGSGDPAARAAAARALEALDRDLYPAGVDVAPDVLALAADARLEVRTAAALFLLHRRPARAVGELERFRDGRAVAAAALSAPLAPHLTAALAELTGRTAGGAGAATEPALAWSGTPAEIEVRGEPASAGRIRGALDLLARQAPDLRHLVGFALATITVGAGGPAVDPALRSAQIAGTEPSPERLALQLVRLATLVFEARVHGLPADGGTALARAVRQEIHALERLTGAPCPPERAEATVRQALAAAGFPEGGDA